MSLLKVEYEGKKALTIELEPAMCDLIHARARATNKTQARYIADLVSGAGDASEILRELFGIMTGDEARNAVGDLERTALELRERIGEG